jgi:dipeptidyl aminopeptidase/acylaminoacyl peptidase
MDVGRRISHAVSLGVEEYVSVAANADGRRLVATVANPARSLWTAPITDRLVDDSGLSPFNLPSLHASTPRFGRDYLLYLSSRGGADGLWKYKDGAETELWKGSDGAVAAAPAISRDGSQIAFVVRGEGRGRLHLMASDGTGAHRIAESLDVRGAPSWAPDGKWIGAVATDGDATPLFKIPADGGAPVPLVEGIASNPVWSPDGRFILYSEGRGGALLQLRAVTPDGRAFPLPEIRGLGFGGDRYRFLRDGKSLVVMRGLLWRQNFFLIDLASGRERQLTDLRPEFEMRSFDTSLDGKQILLDRVRQNSAVVLIDRR